MITKDKIKPKVRIHEDWAEINYPCGFKSYWDVFCFLSLPQTVKYKNNHHNFTCKKCNEKLLINENK